MSQPPQRLAAADFAAAARESEAPSTSPQARISGSTGGLPVYEPPPDHCDGRWHTLFEEGGRLRQMWFAPRPGRCGCKACRGHILGERLRSFHAHAHVAARLANLPAPPGGKHIVLTVDTGSASRFTVDALPRLRKLAARAVRAALREPGANLCIAFHPQGCTAGKYHPHFHVIALGVFPDAGTDEQIQARLGVVWRRNLGRSLSRPLPRLRVFVRTYDWPTLGRVAKHELRNFPGWHTGLRISYMGEWRRQDPRNRRGIFVAPALAVPEENLRAAGAWAKLSERERQAHADLRPAQSPEAVGSPRTPEAVPTPTTTANSSPPARSSGGGFWIQADLSDVAPWNPLLGPDLGFVALYDQHLAWTLRDLHHKTSEDERLADAVIPRLRQLVHQRVVAAPSARKLGAALLCILDDLDARRCGPMPQALEEPLPLLSCGLLSASEVAWITRTALLPSTDLGMDPAAGPQVRQGAPTEDPARPAPSGPPTDLGQP